MTSSEWVSWQRGERAYGPEMAVAVLIADLDRRDGSSLARQLEADTDDLEVVAVCTPDEAAEQAVEHLPDVALLVVDGDGGGEASLVRAVRTAAPSVAVAVLTAGVSSADGYPLIRAGAADIRPRHAGPDEHVATIRRAVTGRAPLSGTTAASARRELHRVVPDLVSELEDRILTGLERGGNVEDVAADLAVAPTAVWRRLGDVRAKLEVVDRVAATRLGPPDVFLGDGRHSRGPGPAPS